MTLFALHVVSETRDTLVLAYYFCGVPVPAQDAFESGLGALLASDAPTRDVDWCTSCCGKPVVGRLHQGLLFALSGSEDTDELALADALPFFLDLVSATCDGKLTVAQLLAYTGKVAVCLHEAAPCGRLVCSDPPTVLRNAKLKSPAL